MVDAAQNFPWWVSGIACAILALIATGVIAEFWTDEKVFLSLLGSFGVFSLSAWLLYSFEEARTTLLVVVITTLAAVFFLVVSSNQRYLKFLVLRRVATAISLEVERARHLNWPDGLTKRRVLRRFRSELRVYHFGNYKKSWYKGLLIVLAGATVVALFSIPWILFESPFATLAAFMGVIASNIVADILGSLGIPARLVGVLLLLAAVAGTYATFRYGVDPRVLLDNVAPTIWQLVLLGALMGPIAAVAIEVILSGALSLHRSQERSFTVGNARNYIVIRCLRVVQMLDQSEELNEHNRRPLSRFLQDIAEGYESHGILDLTHTTEEQDQELRTRCDQLAAEVRSHQLDLEFPRQATLVELKDFLARTALGLLLYREGDFKPPHLPEIVETQHGRWRKVGEFLRALVTAALPIGSIVVAARLGYELPPEYRQSLILATAGWALITVLVYLDPKLGTRIESFSSLLGAARAEIKDAKTQAPDLKKE